MIYIFFLKFFFIFIPTLTLNATEKITDLLVADHEIEIILFEYLDESSVGSELFTSKTQDEKITEATDSNYFVTEDISEQSTSSITNNLEINEIPIEKEILLKLKKNNTLKLRSIYNRLERLSVYNPIIWAGWEQILLNKDKTPDIKIRRIKNTLGNFSGIFQLYRSQGGKIRLAININMNKKNDLTDTEDYNSTPSNKSLKSSVIYSIYDDKEIRYDEIRYFDHPKFGLLVKVNKKDESNILPDSNFVKITPMEGNVLENITRTSDRVYVSSIERGIVGLSKTGKYISLTLNRNGDFKINISDQLEIDRLSKNELGIDSFKYTINDGNRKLNKELSIKITGINDPPLSENKFIIIENNDNLPYSFSEEDFFFYDAENKELDHILITKISEDMELYEDYSFASWSLREGMILNKKEINFLRYMPINMKDYRSSFSFLVNDGEKYSTNEYEFNFTHEQNNTGKEVIENKNKSFIYIFD